MINYFLRFFTMFNSLTGNFNNSKPQNAPANLDMRVRPLWNISPGKDFKAPVNPLSNLLKPGQSPLDFMGQNLGITPARAEFVGPRIPFRQSLRTPKFVTKVPTPNVLQVAKRRERSHEDKTRREIQTNNSASLDLDKARKFPGGEQGDQRQEVAQDRSEIPGDSLQVGIQSRLERGMEHFSIFGNLPLTPTAMPSFTPLPPLDYPLPTGNEFPHHLFPPNITPFSKYPVPCDIECPEVVDCPFGFLQEFCPRCECAPDPCMNPCESDREQCINVAHRNCIDEDPFMCPQYSLCEEIDCDCPPLWQPVCGTDPEVYAKTYINNCSMNCRGDVEKIYDGECWPSNMERIFYSEPSSTVAPNTTATIEEGTNTTVIPTPSLVKGNNESELNNENQGNASSNATLDAIRNDIQENSTTIPTSLLKTLILKSTPTATVSKSATTTTTPEAISKSVTTTTTEAISKSVTTNTTTATSIVTTATSIATTATTLESVNITSKQLSNDTLTPLLFLNTTSANVAETSVATPRQEVYYYDNTTEPSNMMSKQELHNFDNFLNEIIEKETNTTGLL